MIPNIAVIVATYCVLSLIYQSLMLRSEANRGFAPKSTSILFTLAAASGIVVIGACTLSILLAGLDLSNY